MSTIICKRRNGYAILPKCRITAAKKGENPVNHNFKKYVLFWLSGSVSQLGSAMTGFALILWSYTQTGSAMAVSLMSFFNYLPYIMVSLFAGSFVDRRSKKKIMLVSDSLAALCSMAVLFLCLQGALQMWHIYLVNAVLGLMNAFQSPAQSVAVGMLVPKEKLGQASGMDSFSSNLVTVIAPVLASSFFAFGGLESVIALDLVSFLANFVVLLLFIHLPEAPKGATAADTKAPLRLQGSVFGVRNAIQFGTIPVGILLGGFLADYMFEPFMRSGAPVAEWLEGLVGSGTGSGMAVMFLCTGMLGFLASVLTGRSRWVRGLEEVKKV